MIDMEHLAQWIGREDHGAETLTPELAARFARTLDRESETGPGAVAPLLIHLCLAQPVVATAELAADGHPQRGGFLPPVPLPRRMWAGGAFDFSDELRIGDRIARRSVIEAVKAKTGRSGSLCFVTVKHHFSREGETVLTERQDIVYRDAGEAASRPAPPRAPIGSDTRTIVPSAPLLFRYSALTFNAHRIHYDAPYAREVEGYPGLVVHGPLQATLLVQFAADLAGRRPTRFAFRSNAPVFDTGIIELHAREEGESLRLWTAQTGGPVAMEAEATW